MGRIVNLRKSKAELEQRVLDDLRDSLREQFPNQARQGCPSSEEIRRLASRRVPLAKAQEWIDHLGRCSACFSDFERHQRKFTHRRRLYLAFALSAAVAAVCILGAILLKNARGQFGGAKLAVHEQRTELPVAVLNLSDTSNLRGGGEGSRLLAHLPRSRFVLSVHLPPGNMSGQYEIQFLREIIDAVPLVQYHASSELENGNLTISIVTDLSHVQPGTYIFAIRHAGSEWIYSEVDIS
jgi:hypothetical protein